MPSDAVAERGRDQKLGRRHALGGRGLQCFDARDGRDDAIALAPTSNFRRVIT